MCLLMCAYTHMCIVYCVCVCLCMCICVLMCTCVCVWISVCACLYSHVCTCVCAWVGRWVGKENNSNAYMLLFLLLCIHLVNPTNCSVLTLVSETPCYRNDPIIKYRPLQRQFNLKQPSVLLISSCGTTANCEHTVTMSYCHLHCCYH